MHETSVYDGKVKEDEPSKSDVRPFADTDEPEFVDTLTLDVSSADDASGHQTPSHSLPIRMRTGEYSRAQKSQKHGFPESTPEPETTCPHPLDGVGFNELRLEQPVGSGGIAELHLAYHEANGDDPFVVKIARDELKENPHVHAQFDREWRASRLLKHPGLIPHYSRGATDDGRPFIAMELVTGRPLSYFVKHPVTWRFLRASLLQLCDVLHYVHSCGVLHQDLKPSNILVDLKRRRIRVTDFGLARFGAAQAGATTCSVLGTPCYMAPEQARGLLGWLGPHTDLYTVGIMITELLSGRKPFEDDEDRVVMIKHCTVPPPPLKVRDGINPPDGIARLVERLLSKSPEARFQSAASLKRAIKEL